MRGEEEGMGERRDGSQRVIREMIIDFAWLQQTSVRHKAMVYLSDSENNAFYSLILSPQTIFFLNSCKTFSFYAIYAKVFHHILENSAD